MYKAGEVAHCDKIVRDVLGDQLELHISGILQIKESEKFTIQMKIRCFYNYQREQGWRPLAVKKEQERLK